MARTILTEAQIAERLLQLNGWTVENMRLQKTFQVDTYMAGLAFASAVGTVCEALDHHPDIHIGWRRVTVSFTTHDVGNVLTESDFRAANAVDALRYPKA
ncbi:MAG: 4a-hydroxytetrahydrobiopterin dehydratase [Anaerolineae bacterium]|nr:4a-hydroxytetrahydrobiopterin dehydratase [Anaerolineae bacterium]